MLSILFLKSIDYFFLNRIYKILYHCIAYCYIEWTSRSDSLHILQDYWKKSNWYLRNNLVTAFYLIILKMKQNLAIIASFLWKIFLNHLQLSTVDDIVLLIDKGTLGKTKQAIQIYGFFSLLLTLKIVKNFASFDNLTVLRSVLLVDWIILLWNLRLCISTSIKIFYGKLI